MRRCAQDDSYSLKKRLVKEGILKELCIPLQSGINVSVLGSLDLFVAFVDPQNMDAD